MEWRAPGAEEIWGFWIGLLRLLLDNGLFGSLEVPVEYPDFAVGKPQEQQWFKDFTLFLCIYPPCSLFKLPVWWCWCCSLRHSMNQIINWSGLKIILQHREEGRSAVFFFSLLASAHHFAGWSTGSCCSSNQGMTQLCNKDRNKTVESWGDVGTP